MPTETPPPPRDRWCDIDSNHVTLFSWVEQITEDPKHRAPSSQRAQHGEVIGRSPDLLYIRLQDEWTMTGIPPQLLRLLPQQPDKHG